MHINLLYSEVKSIRINAALPEDNYKTIIRVSASDLIGDKLADWIRKNLKENNS